MPFKSKQKKNFKSLQKGNLHEKGVFHILNRNPLQNLTPKILQEKRSYPIGRKLTPKVAILKSKWGASPMIRSLQAHHWHVAGTSKVCKAVKIVKLFVANHGAHASLAAV